MIKEIFFAIIVAIGSIASVEAWVCNCTYYNTRTGALLPIRLTVQVPLPPLPRRLAQLQFRAPGITGTATIQCGDNFSTMTTGGMTDASDWEVDTCGAE